MGVLCRGGDLQTGRNNVQCFLYNLKADGSGVVNECLGEKSLRNSAFSGVGLVEQVDKNVGIEEVNVHSFHPA